MKKAGFTLIELLVVVLIIGILAAVAIPQYQAVTLRARAAELFINLKAAREASDVYFLANGRRPLSWLEVDVKIPYIRFDDDGCANFCENGRLVAPNGNEYYFDVDGYIGAALADGRVDLSHWYTQAKTGLFKGRYVCRVPAADKAANQACLSLGGKLNGVQGSRNVYAID